MISREVRVYGVLVAMALVVAFMAWNKDQSPKKASTAQKTHVVWDLKPADAQVVTLTSPKVKTTLTYRGKGEDRWIWIDREETKQRRLPPPKPSETPEPGSSPVPDATPIIEKVTTHKSFTGGVASQALFDRVTPLKATRRLGKVDKGALEQFDLDEPEMELVLTSAKGKHTLKIGATAPGGGSYYVMNEKEEVFLVAQSAVKPFTDSATGLMQKTLHTLSDKDIASITVTGRGKTVELTQHNRTSAKERFWSRSKKAEGAKKDVQFKTWVGTIKRLPIMKYPDEQPTSEPAPTFTLTYKGDDGKEIAKLELVAGSGGKLPLVRTEKTRVWAEANPQRTDQVLAELDPILGGSS